jgi:hypothetical protein
MKKLLLISALTIIAVSCSNSGKTEAQEEKQRDSIDNAKLDENQRLVDSMERADEAKQHDSMNHDHNAPGHEDHKH